VSVRHERWLWAAVLLLGAALRLAGWSRPELDAQEAAAAWPAAQAARGQGAAADDVTNATLTAAQATLFAFAGPDVVLARLPAALCGVALVLVPLLLRDALGPLGALALALLVAVSPGLVQSSRQAAGASAALLAAALAAAGILRWARSARVDASAGRRWAVVTSAAAGMLLASGVEAWSLVPLVGLVAFALRPWAECPPPWRRCAAALGLAALLTATAGLWVLRWASAVSASLTVWLGRFGAPADASPLLDLARSQPLALLLLLVGLAVTTRDAPARGLAIAAALAWAVILATRGGDAPAVLSAVLAVAAAAGATWLLLPGPRGRERRLGLAVAGVAFVAQAALAARVASPPATVPSVPGLETLAADLERIAIARGREAHELPVRVVGERPDPEVAWALRASRRFGFAERRPLPVEGLAPVLVTRAVEPTTAPPAGYIGATYGSSRGKVNLWVPLEP
jgi:hypothetical protein